MTARENKAPRAPATACPNGDNCCSDDDDDDGGGGGDDDGELSNASFDIAAMVYLVFN